MIAVEDIADGHVAELLLQLLVVTTFPEQHLVPGVRDVPFPREHRRRSPHHLQLLPVELLEETIRSETRFREARINRVLLIARAHD